MQRPAVWCSLFTSFAFNARFVEDQVMNVWLLVENVNEYGTTRVVQLVTIRRGNDGEKLG